MRLGMQDRRKLIALLALAAIGAPLLYRNLLSPGEPNLPATLTRTGTAREEPVPGPPPASPPSRNRQGLRDRTMSQPQLAALDPTLRVDLLEKSRQVEYAGESRNIFQFYTPPPPPPPEPVSAPVIQTPLPSRSLPAPAASSNIPLKFYGVASRPGTSQKKAFLTDEEEIFIGEEGDLIANRYKIIHIGMNTIELEDSRDKRRHQLPLLEQ